MNREQLEDTIKHPITVVASVILALAGIDPSILVAFAATIWYQAGTIFTALSIFSFTVVPEVPQLAPLAPYAVPVALGFGLVYIAKLGYTVFTQVRETA